MKYPAEAKALWEKYVPRSGQAETVQGELIRAVEKLRDEAVRNGNVNWDDGFEILACFIRDTLVSSGQFDPFTQKAISRETARLLDYERPVTDDGPFDRLAEWVVEWSRRHPEPVPHARNPNLRR